VIYQYRNIVPFVNIFAHATWLTRKEETKQASRNSPAVIKGDLLLRILAK